MPREHYGVNALGVTLSRRQAGWAQRTIVEAGLQRRAEVRFLDYRDVLERGFDAISSVGAMEHIGSAKLRSHFRCDGRLPAARGPNAQPHDHAPSNRERPRPGPFIDRYVFPDGELESLATALGAMHDEGLEIRHEENLREHYAMTLRSWGRQPRTQLEASGGGGGGATRARVAAVPDDLARRIRPQPLADPPDAGCARRRRRRLRAAAQAVLEAEHDVDDLRAACRARRRLAERARRVRDVDRDPATGARACA